VGLVRYDTVVVEGRTGRAAALRLLYSGTGMRNGRDECRDWALLAQQESFLLSVVRQVFGWPVIIVGVLAGVVCDCFSVRIYSSTVRYALDGLIIMLGAFLQGEEFSLS